MNITWSELDKIDSPNVIDIRSNNQYVISHYPKAKNIPGMELAIKPEKYLNRKDTYYIYCQSGVTSAKICQTLNKKNFKTINILGGYQAKK